MGGLLDKIDKEKRDRVSSLAEVQHKFEDDNEHLSNKLHARIAEVIKDVDDKRNIEIAKTNQDIDDLHETLVGKINAANANVDDKFILQEKKDNAKFTDFAKKIEDEGNGLKKFLEDEKDVLQAKLDQETRNRIDDIDKINDIISKEHQNNLKVENQIKDLSTTLAS